MITDLFSHKIHSSGDEWPEKLVDLASIFNEFDGQVYDREAIESRLREISPRVSHAARDVSKFRDEISAYPAYLGLYKLELVGGKWVLFLSSTAKRFLIIEEPDVEAFMRLQLLLFQYPNGMGVAYYSNTNKLRIQANSRDKTLEFIRQGVHLSPLRLICRAILADAEITGNDIFQAKIAIKELYALANSSSTNSSVCPSLSVLKRTLVAIRDGEIKPPAKYESRFHILRHTGLFEITKSSISLRRTDSSEDLANLRNQFLCIADQTCQFTGFDAISTQDELISVVSSGTWGNYFDGLQSLSGETIEILSGELIGETQRTLTFVFPVVKPEKLVTAPIKYPFRRRMPTVSGKSSAKAAQAVDPEITKIKRQRRNLYHKLLLDQLEQLFKKTGASPVENEHIDLYAEVPNDGAFLFEVKSGGENLLDQIRKGVSQLYEYKYRYKDVIRNDATLCLLLPESPSREFPWMENYLCADRDITVCWFNSEGMLDFPTPFGQNLIPLKEIIGIT